MDKYIILSPEAKGSFNDRLNFLYLKLGNFLDTEKLENRTLHMRSHSKIFYLLNISELSTLKNVTANDLETSYILFLSQLCNIQRTL